MLKSSLITTFAVLFFVGSIAANSINTPQNNVTNQDIITKIINIQSKLLANNWDEDLTDYPNEAIADRQISFLDYGVVDIITTHTSGVMKYKSLLWRIENTKTGIRLILTTQKQLVDCVFIVSEYGNELILTQENGDWTMRLFINDSFVSTKKGEVSDMLIGDWETELLPLEVNEACENGDAYMKYHFNQDGTYLTTSGYKTSIIAEQGVWSISKDGQYIIFHISMDRSPENIYTTKVAKIDMLEDGSLVLNQSFSMEQTIKDGIDETPHNFYFLGH